MTTQNGFHSVESLELSLHHRFFTASSADERAQALQELEELIKVYPQRRSNERVVKVLGPVAESPEQLKGTPDERIDWGMARRHLELHGFAADELVVITFFPPKGTGRPAEHRHYLAALPEKHGATSLEAMQRWLDAHPGYSLGFVIGHGDSAKKAGITGVSAIPWEDDSESTSREEKADQWRQTDLPQPTYQLDTGGKSVHHWYRLSEPCSVAAYSSAQKLITRHIKGKLGSTALVDSSLSDASQVMRLAGGIHPSTGQRTTLLNVSGELFTLPQLMQAVSATVELQAPVAAEPATGDGTARDWDDWFARMPIHKQIETLVGFAKQDKWPRRGGPAGTHAAGHWDLIPKLFGALLGQFATTEEVVRLFSETTWAKKFEWSEVNGGSMEEMLKSVKGGEHPGVGTLVWLATRRVDDANQPLTTKPARLPKGVKPPTSIDADITGLVKGTQQRVKQLKQAMAVIDDLDTPLERETAHQNLSKSLGCTEKEMLRLLNHLETEQDGAAVRGGFWDDVVANAKPIQPVVERLLASNAVTMVASDGGIGKSVLIYRISEAVAYGRKFAGCLDCVQGNVLVVQKDESDSNLGQKAEVMGMRDPDRRIKVEFTFNAGMFKELRQWIRKQNAKLVVMDSFGSLFGGGADLSEADAGLYLYRLNAIASEEGCAILVTHHLRKQGKDKAERTDIHAGDLFGSSYIVNGSSDVWGVIRDPQHKGVDPCFLLKILKPRTGISQGGDVYRLVGSRENLSFELESLNQDAGLLKNLKESEQLVLKALRNRTKETALTITELTGQVNKGDSATYRAVQSLWKSHQLKELGMTMHREEVKPTGGKGGRASLVYWIEGGGE